MGPKLRITDTLENLGVKGLDTTIKEISTVKDFVSEYHSSPTLLHVFHEPCLGLSVVRTLCPSGEP